MTATLNYLSQAIDFLETGDERSALQNIQYAIRHSEKPHIDLYYLSAFISGKYDDVLVEKSYTSQGELGEELRSLAKATLPVPYPLEDFGQEILINSSDDIKIAQANIYRKKHDYSLAHTIVDSLKESYNITLVECLLYFDTQRWDKLLHRTNHLAQYESTESTKDLIHLLSGVASLYLGHDAGGKELTYCSNLSSYPSIQSRACYYLGLLHRSRGDEHTAKTFIDTARVIEDRDIYTEAATNSSVQLVTTSIDKIARRENPWIADTTEDTHDDEQRRNILDKALADLDTQIGLEEVKDQVKKLKAKASMSIKRQEAGLKSVSSSLHMAFTGPPGAGKTTIARIIAAIYYGLGIVKENKLVEVSRKDLVGQHLGSTADKTQKVIDKALDGILFIDEAYMLVQQGLSGGDAYGQEAIDTLLKPMVEQKDRLIVIIAGYKKDIERFLESNDGLRSRIRINIDFPSYSVEECAAIMKIVAQRNDDVISPEAIQLFTSYEGVWKRRMDVDKSILDLEGNARFMENIYASAVEEREFRLDSRSDLEMEDYTTVTVEDIQPILEKYVKKYSTI